MSEQQFYPVKRRGERRRLDPNWLGIAWLEADVLGITQITSRTPFGDGHVMLRTEGVLGTHHRRPMIETIPLQTVGIRRPARGVNCPDCGNLAYTTDCDQKHEYPTVLPGFTEPMPSRLETFGDSIRITFQVDDRMSERIDELRNMTFGEWRERNGIA